MRVHNYSVYLDEDGYTMLVRKDTRTSNNYFQWCVRADNRNYHSVSIEEFLSGEYYNDLSALELSKLKLVCHVKSKNT